MIQISEILNHLDELNEKVRHQVAENVFQSHHQI